MKRQIALILIMLVAMLPLTYVEGAQVVHIGFEDFALTSFSSGASVSNTGTTWVKVASFSVSFPSEKYLTGVTVKWTSKNIDDGDNIGGTGYYKIKVVVGSATQVGNTYSHPWGTETHMEAFAFTELHGSSFTVDVYAQAYGDESGDTYQVVVNDVYIYSMNEDYGVKSKLTELKYVPPGADGTNNGLILNQTEVELGQTYNLPQGAVTFWLKWDGQNVTISDNIKAVITYDDRSGTVYGGIVVTNSDGDEYKLENVLVPGVYTKVYIGWTAGGGYIATDNATVNLNWVGNLTLSKIGNLNDKTQSIIDEFYLYDSYVSLDSLKAPNQATMVVTFPDGSATHIIITDDSGTLDSLTVSLYSLNNTLLNSTTWEGVGNDITFTTNESMVLAVLSAPGGSTTVLVRPGVNETVVVPGTVATHIQAVIEPSSYPTGSQRQWTWLIVRDAQGRLVYFNKWNFEGTPVLLKSGESYLVAVATENLTSVYGAYFGLASPSIKITLPKPDDLTKFTNITVFYSVKESDNTFRIYFYDPSGQTSEVNIVLYDDGLNPMANVTYHASLVDVKFNALPFKFTLTYVRNGKEYVWSRVLGYTNAQGIASELGSRKLLGFALIEGMLFAFGSLSAMWAPAVTLAFAIPLSMSGMIELPALIITYLGGMAFFAWFQQLNLDAPSLKQLAIKILIIVFVGQMTFGIANYYGKLGWGTGGYISNDTIEVAGEQITFWQNYTPTYSSYGIPVSSDSRTFMNFIYAVLNGTGAFAMALGAPPEFARLINTLVWALESALLLYLLLGREV